MRFSCTPQLPFRTGAVCRYLNAVPDALAQLWQGVLDAPAQMLQGRKLCSSVLAAFMFLLQPVGHGCCNLQARGHERNLGV